MNDTMVTPSSAEGLPTRMVRMLKHLWMDAGDARKAVPPALAESLASRIAGSERRHAGEIRLCVEAALPLSYLWRVGRHATLSQVVRERALMMFGKLGVWDTERNTGVLVYVLLAERAIEIVADRGLRVVPAQAWQTVADELALAFREGRQETGLAHALERIDALLAHAGLAADAVNELPDLPHLQ